MFHLFLFFVGFLFETDESLYTPPQVHFFLKREGIYVEVVVIKHKSRNLLASDY